MIFAIIEAKPFQTTFHCPSIIGSDNAGEMPKCIRWKWQRDAVFITFRAFSVLRLQKISLVFGGWHEHPHITGSILEAGMETPRKQAFGAGPALLP